MKVLLLVALAAAVSSASADSADFGFMNTLRTFSTQVSSWFETYEEAPYAEIGGGFEHRRYPSAPWVCTAQTVAVEDQEGKDGMFYKLFKYITGNNEQGETIPMTIPVTTEYTVEGDSKTFEMCFYIGQDHQENPATPLADDVVVKTRPTMDVYTRVVPGYFDSDSDWLEEAEALKGILEAAGKTVDMNHMFWVGYDAPMKLINRRNEVWFVAQ